MARNDENCGVQMICLCGFVSVLRVALNGLIHLLIQKVFVSKVASGKCLQKFMSVSTQLLKPKKSKDKGNR